MWYMILIALCVFNNTFCVPEEPCDNETDCTTSDECQCFCAIKCDYRDKTEADKPVYKPDDPYGKYCYCNKRDYQMVQEHKCRLEKKESFQLERKK